MLALVPVKFRARRDQADRSVVLHLWQNKIVEMLGAVASVFEPLAAVVEAHLVAVLVDAVVCAVLLDGVVRQMDGVVIQVVIFHRVFIPGQPQVPLSNFDELTVKNWTYSKK